MNHAAFGLTRDALLSKSTSIGEPASNLAIIQFEQKNGILLHSDLRSFFLISNGLVGAGDFLISIRAIEAVEPFKYYNNSPHCFIFGDIMLDSDDIVTDFSDPMSPVMMVGAREVLAANFSALMAEIIA